MGTKVNDFEPLAVKKWKEKANLAKKIGFWTFFRQNRKIRQKISFFPITASPQPAETTFFGFPRCHLPKTHPMEESMLVFGSSRDWKRRFSPQKQAISQNRHYFGHGDPQGDLRAFRDPQNRVSQPRKPYRKYFDSIVLTQYIYLKIRHIGRFSEILVRDRYSSSA